MPPKKEQQLTNRTTDGVSLWLCGLQPSAKTAFLLITLISTFISVQAFSIPQEQATSSYIYNFAKNVRWPNESNLETFNIASVGEISPAQINELRNLAKLRKIKNAQIKITQLNKPKDLKKYHILYVEKASDQLIERIYAKIDQHPVLLVTNKYPNPRLVMLNLTQSGEKRLGFEVNKANMLNHGLTPLPELILIGGTEIDVAKLYREGQASLFKFQKELIQKEEQLNQLEQRIQSQQYKNLSLEKELGNITNKIRFSEQENKRLQSQAEEKSREIATQLSKLEKNKQEFNELSKEIEKGKQALTELNTTIDTQQVELLEKNTAISELDDLVNAQLKSLTYLRALTILGILFALSILTAYLVKRRDNLRLKQHGKELKLAHDRLAIAKAKADDANLAKTEFLSLMSHELRTPLQAIIGYTDVVIEELQLEGQDYYVDDLNRVINNSQRLLRLINGVLDLAKIESGRMELNLSEIQLSDLVEEAIASVRPQIEKNTNTLKMDIENGDNAPLIDHDKLLHILINLLGNAAKFTHNGTISIDMKHEPSAITLIVADTGIGMNKQQQRHIFERFKQADSSITRKYQGSGLGLNITSKFCEFMGGTIFVESEENKGSTFHVNIPLPIVATPRQDTIEYDEETFVDESDTETDIEDKKKVLLVDDDPAFTDIMARVLRKEGYRVYTAACADEGVSIAKSVVPDIMVLDLLLPDQHGWMMYKNLKEDPALKDVPVIVASIIDDRSRSKELGVEGFLTKPVAKEVLKHTVQNLVVK